MQSPKHYQLALEGNEENMGNYHRTSPDSSNIHGIFEWLMCAIIFLEYSKGEGVSYVLVSPGLGV